MEQYLFGSSSPPRRTEPFTRRPAKRIVPKLSAPIQKDGYTDITQFPPTETRYQSDSSSDEMYDDNQSVDEIEESIEKMKLRNPEARKPSRDNVPDTPRSPINPSTKDRLASPASVKSEGSVKITKTEQYFKRTESQVRSSREHRRHSDHVRFKTPSPDKTRHRSEPTPRKKREEKAKEPHSISDSPTKLASEIPTSAESHKSSIQKKDKQSISLISSEESKDVTDPEKPRHHAELSLSEESSDEDDHDEDDETAFPNMAASLDSCRPTSISYRSLTMNSCEDFMQIKVRPIFRQDILSKIDKEMKARNVKNEDFSQIRLVSHQMVYAGLFRAISKALLMDFRIAAVGIISIIQHALPGLIYFKSIEVPKLTVPKDNLALEFIFDTLKRYKGIFEKSITNKCLNIGDKCDRPDICIWQYLTRMIDKKCDPPLMAFLFHAITLIRVGDARLNEDLLKILEIETAIDVFLNYIK